MKRAFRAMQSFFFAPESPRILAAVRMAAGLVLFYESARHWLFAVELYSTSGPALPLYDVHIAGLPIPGAWGVIVLVSLQLAAFLTLTLGWHTRTSAAVAFVICLWLWPLDRAGTFAKYSVLAIHLLALLAFSGAGRCWAIDAILAPDESRIAPWPRRLLQFLVCCVYLGAAFTKVRTSGFSNGDLLTFSLLDEHWGAGSWGQYLAISPRLASLASQATMLLEFLFPFLVWVPQCRRVILAAAFAMHAGMGMLMHIGIFSPIMVTLLLSFLREEDFDLLAAFWHKLRRKSPATVQPSRAMVVDAIPAAAVSPARNAWRAWSWCGWALTWFVITGLATFVLWRFDGSEVFGNRAASPLREIPAAEAERRLVVQQPAYEDYFHRIEPGTRFSGNQTFGRRDRFRLGETIYLLIQVIPDHPQMDLEGSLLDPTGKEVRRASVHLDASASYSVMAFELEKDFAVGEYRLLLSAESVDVWQKRVRIVP